MNINWNIHCPTDLTLEVHYVLAHCTHVGITSSKRCALELQSELCHQIFLSMALCPARSSVVPVVWRLIDFSSLLRWIRRWEQSRFFVSNALVQSRRSSISLCYLHGQSVPFPVALLAMRRHHRTLFMNWGASLCRVFLRLATYCSSASTTTMAIWSILPVAPSGQVQLICCKLL